MEKRIGNLIEEKIRSRKNDIVPILKNLENISLVEGKKFEVCAKATKDLSLIASNPLLSYETKGEVKTKNLKVGALFSGGPAAGGHNVIVGLYDALKELNPNSQVIGFLNGPDGLLNSDYKVLTDEDINNVRNLGGFYLLGTSRTKFEKETDLLKCYETIQKLNLDGLLIIGGDDSNTNAAHLSHYLLDKKSSTVVVGIPKTIDGDLAYLPYLQTSFGFYTAAMTYSEMIGNICRDLTSSRKIWHFVKLMGRSASWITLEAAFQTQPNVALIGEEIKQKNMTLSQVIDMICDVIGKRYNAGKKYGIVLIPEGIVEFIPEIKSLIKEINKAIVNIGNENFLKMHITERREKVIIEISPENERLFAALPTSVQNGLLSGLDPHGNVQVSQIASDVLIMELVSEKMHKKGIKLTTQTHFYGYDGRCGYPTWFDATYTYNLGRAASVLIAQNKTGYMVTINNLHKPFENWKVQAIPLAGMMNVEERKGKESLVISKYLVDLNCNAFKEFEKTREKWALEDCYLCPGPIQFFGDDEIVKSKSITMTLNG